MHLYGCRIQISSLFYITLTAALFFLTSKVCAQEFQWSEKHDQRIDSVVKQTMQDFHYPGAAIALIKNDKVLKESYYGLASIEFQVPVSDSTVFWLGSISKHYDCVAILKLQEQGKLNIHDRIQEYLPDIPENWEDITIEHLMTHTSGLPLDGTDSSRGDNSVKDGMVYTSEIMYEGLKNDTLRFKPGTGYLYSGAGYSLLSLIMERISGLGYSEFMEKEIFRPLGMKNTYIMDVNGIHPNQASGYRWYQGSLQQDRNDFRLIDKELGAGGGVYTSLPDMIKWNKMLNSNTFLNRESIESMFKAHQIESGLSTFYGYGFDVNKNGALNIVTHPGIAGTEYLKDLNNGIDLIILTNLGQPDKTPFRYRIMKSLGLVPKIKADEFIKPFEIELGLPESYSVDQLIGRYRGDAKIYPFNIEIRNINDQISVIYEDSNLIIPLLPLKDDGLMEFEDFNYYPSTHYIWYKPVLSSGNKIEGLDIYHQGIYEGSIKKTD